MRPHTALGIQEKGANRRSSNALGRRGLPWFTALQSNGTVTPLCSSIDVLSFMTNLLMTLCIGSFKFSRLSRSHLTHNSK